MLSLPGKFASYLSLATTVSYAHFFNSCGRGGIGEALVLEYARRGIHPIATVLPNENSDHLVEAGITFFPLDVTVDESVVALKAEVQKLTGGRLDILVNCAGIAYTMTAIDTDVAAVQRMFDINLFGPMRMVCNFHDFIIRAKGKIVNIGSIGGIIPFLYGCTFDPASFIPPPPSRGDYF